MSKAFKILLTSTALLTATSLAAAQTPHNHASQQDATKRHGQKAQKVSNAVVVLQPVGKSGVEGTLYLEETEDGLKITGEVRGLKKGKHGFHVHEFGDLSDCEKGKSAGSHYNPVDKPHGKPNELERHVGDFGNIEADDKGVAKVDYTDPIALLNGPYGILGRAIVVHAGEDKFTQPTGDAGDRVAFGIIGVAKSDSKDKTSTGLHTASTDKDAAKKKDDAAKAKKTPDSQMAGGDKSKDDKNKPESNKDKSKDKKKTDNDALTGRK